MKKDTNQEKIAALLAKKSWTEEERRWMRQYLDETEQQELKQLLEEEFKPAMQETRDDLSDKLLARINAVIDAEERFTGKERPRRHIRRWLSIAASVMLMSATAYFVYLSKSTILASAEDPQSPTHPTDILPGTNNAVLTLADGTSIMLDSASNGLLANQSNVHITKRNGEIVYSGQTGKPARPALNSIVTAKGNQYQITLSDGSKAWLNAASSLKFPAVFGAGERRVEITGEVYFEISKDPSRPFVVNWQNMAGKSGTVKVLGTHFNVNAYPDESVVKTTLIEGKVSMLYEKQMIHLLPGSEGTFDNSNDHLRTQPGDIEQAIAWKEGSFEFHNTSLDNIMRQLARWYDIEVVFEEAIQNKTFYGSIRREATLSQALKILELAGIKWSINKNLLTIGKASNP